MLATICALLVLLFTLSSGAAAQNTISTVAGGGSNAGSPTAADLPGPSSVVKDGLGNTYLAVPSAQYIFKVDSTGNLSVFAGIGYPTEEPPDNVPATSTSLNMPTGLGLDAGGDLYIADTANYKVREVDTAGIIHLIAGNGHQCGSPTAKCGDGGPGTSAQLTSPSAVAVDGSGNVYIADTGDNRVRVVAGGIISTIVGTGAPCSNPTSACGDGGAAASANLNSPMGIALDGSGNLYIADSGDHRIRVVNLKTRVITAYAGNGVPCNRFASCGDGGSAAAANLSNPWQIFVVSGNLYIADAPTNRVRLVNASQVISTIAGTGFGAFGGDGGPASSAWLNSPRGVFADAAGNVFIGDTGNQRVRMINAQQTINTFAGGGSGGDNSGSLGSILATDRNIALDATGGYYIADTGNNRIRYVSAGGTITTVAGRSDGVAGYSGDGGPATAATLNFPYDAAADSAGNLYIADSYNLVIRRVNGGMITTVAGTGQPCNPTSSCGDGGPATSATLGFPASVAVDNAGNYYIADEAANRIRRVDVSTGIITTVAGTGVACSNPLAPGCGDGGPATAAQLYAPMGVAVDASGNLFIADTGDNRIREVNTSGTINAYAFNGQPTFSGNGGPALNASFGAPQFVTVDSRDNLYVSGTTFYYLVQRVSGVDPNHSVITVAGRQGDPKYYGFQGDGGLSTKAAINNSGAAIGSSGNLYIADSGNNRVRLVQLSPGAQVSPSTLQFGPQPLGTTSPAQTVSLKDTGFDDLLVSNITVTGDFAQTSKCSAVAPTLSCPISVTFTPTGYGQQHGTLTIYDNAYSSPSQSVSLVGSGPDFSPSVSPNSVTLTPGQSATLTLTITPIAGYNQTVTLGCINAPSGATCKVSPSSVTLNGTSASTATVTIQTSASTPAGTYTLQTGGKGTGLTHGVPITLTVQ